MVRDRAAYMKAWREANPGFQREYKDARKKVEHAAKKARYERLGGK